MKKINSSAFFHYKDKLVTHLIYEDGTTEEYKVKLFRWSFIL